MTREKKWKGLTLRYCKYQGRRHSGKQERYQFWHTRVAGQRVSRRTLLALKEVLKRDYGPYLS